MSEKTYKYTIEYLEDYFEQAYMSAYIGASTNPDFDPHKGFKVWLTAFKLNMGETNEK